MCIKKIKKKKKIYKKKKRGGAFKGYYNYENDTITCIAKRRKKKKKIYKKKKIKDKNKKKIKV
jgi:hypothetical protein